MTMQPHVSRNRLLKLADLLDSLPSKKFNYGIWASGEGKLHECGTTGCALGWATTIPSLGLKLQPLIDKEGGGEVYDVKVVHKETGHEDFNAGALAFDLDYSDVEYLFYPNFMHPWDPGLPESPPAHATAKQVAKHIRRFVKARFPQKKK